MVSHPADYPWSSYRANALGQVDACVTPHTLYWGLGLDDAIRQSAYRALFDDQMDESTITQLREATNKAWVLGRDSFKQKIDAQLNRRADKMDRGGDRKSKAYKESISQNQLSLTP